MTTASQLSAVFVAELRSYLTPYQWSEMQHRNANESNPDICHSHDFCDANMAMIAAFETLMGRAPDAGFECDAEMINAAWAAAKPRLTGEFTQASRAGK